MKIRSPLDVQLFWGLILFTLLHGYFKGQVLLCATFSPDLQGDAGTHFAAGRLFGLSVAEKRRNVLVQKAVNNVYLLNQSQ